MLLMGKSTISMAIFNSYPKLPEGMNVFLFQVVGGGNNRCVLVFNMDFINIRIDGGHPSIMNVNVTMYNQLLVTMFIVHEHPAFFDNIE